MLARIQRGILPLVLLAISGWAWFAATAEEPFGWRWGVLPLIALPHAPLLGLEFALLSWFGHSTPAQRPALTQLISAWWGEVCAGAAVFGWRQPWASTDIPDDVRRNRPSRQRGVVLVHGFVCNRGLWNPWMSSLRMRDRAFVAVNLEPIWGSIDEYVTLIDAAVERVQDVTGLPPVVVAHSMGGLATRAWLRDRDADARVHRVITVGTPHHGTWLGRFALSANGRQMRTASPWITRLAAQESAARRSAFTCFFGHCDNIVFPAATATLEGAENRHLPGVAHLAMVYAPEVYAELERWLDQ